MIATSYNLIVKSPRTAGEGANESDIWDIQCPVYTFYRTLNVYILCVYIVYILHNIH